MNTPLLSVCLITYNHKDYISEAIEGVLMQKINFKIELIIADDCSTDGTIDIINKYRKENPTLIRIIQQEINVGPANNWLVLMNSPNTKTEYISYFEGDDYWTDPLKLQKQVDFLEGNPDFGICFHRANLLKNDEFSLHPIPSLFEKESFKYIQLLEHYNFITTASVVFRKPEKFIFPTWFTKIPYGDMGLYKLVSKEMKIKCLKDNMSVYRIHEKGIWSGLTQLEEEKNYLSFYNIMFDYLNKEEKKVVKIKAKKSIKKISKLKFSKSLLLQKLFSVYLRLIFKNI